jgi:CheY-like chemotaxis protein
VKVLIVDPDASRAAAVVEALSASGARSTVAPSALFALTMLERNQHDVIISRASVGDMDGQELCGLVRADPSTAGVRFVLIASGVTQAQTSQVGIDLVIPEGLIGPAIATRVMHLMRREPAPAAPPSSRAIVAAPTAATSPDDAAPPIPLTPIPLVARTPEPPPPAVTAPPLIPAPPPVTPEPAVTVSPAVTPEPVVTASSAVTPEPILMPRPVPAPPPSAPTPAAPPSPALNPVVRGAAPPPPPLTELEAVGMNGAMRTFQGALGSLALEDLAQAIIKGSKTGRLLLVLSTGGGMIAFDGGRVVHAEVGNTTGETAFQSLVAASHHDSGGKFCFIPSAPRDLANVPKTITRSVAELLHGAAPATNEEKR